jgi:hypothetical protein
MSATFDTMTLNGLDFHVWWNHTDPEGDWPDAAILVRHPETGLLGTWEPETGAVHVFPEDPVIGSKPRDLELTPGDSVSCFVVFFRSLVSLGLFF